MKGVGCFFIPVHEWVAGIVGSNYGVRTSVNEVLDVGFEAGSQKIKGS